ncbi:MAG TPA: dienelactone hydrolase family protein [Chitinophagales bacterium]|nr:dienelactone hydrolase family protein [Chitinophagales bacterium]
MLAEKSKPENESNHSSALNAVIIPVNGIRLKGLIKKPAQATGLIIFSHGSGSSRFSPRNTLVAERLHATGFATLLLDLLTEKEDQSYKNRFDIELLTERLAAATAWAEKNSATKDLPIGYFGASTGAASALYAAAQLGDTVRAVVSRGGRPDLAMDALAGVKAATLLIVGELDAGVLELNRQAFEKLTAEKEIQIIPGATHLFEEPGKLEKVADLAASWFQKHLAKKK